MTDESKDTKPSTIVENKKIQLTEEELKKISGGLTVRKAGEKPLEYLRYDLKITQT
jgi:bacteriocin-like protein